MAVILPQEFAVYATYDELVGKLESLAKDHPGLVSLKSVGKTRQGRDLWLATVTNRASGDPSAKPAMYIDGNHHAGEVTGSAACLYTIAYLAKNHGSDPVVTALLYSRAFYILPRVSPDGAELYLTTAYMLRSTPRAWPLDRPDDGIVPEDIDNNGKILMMRVPDPDGEFKASDKDPRLMVRRLPDETGGRYYRVYTEGLVQGYDGAELKNAAARWGLDLNRNYPVNWGGETKQPGSGPYPLSEPETRAVTDFVAANKNIAGLMSYHTTGGIILRPRCTAADLDIPALDLVAYKALGRRGTEITSYPCKSIFEGFTRDKRKPSIGSVLDLSYDHLGIISFATELWDLQKRAGIPDREMAAQAHLSEEEEEQDGLKVLKWLDSEMAGEGFAPWANVSHPQLGEVEVGGVDPKFIRQNPPLKLLHQECHKNMMFTLAVAAAMPLVRLESLDARDLGAGLFHVTVVVSNSGFLPSSGSLQAQNTKCARPVEVTLELPRDSTLLSGKVVQELGHLPGRAGASGSPSSTGSKKRAVWLLDLSKAARPWILTLKLDGSRGGKDARTIELGT